MAAAGLHVNRQRHDRRAGAKGERGRPAGRMRRHAEEGHEYAVDVDILIDEHGEDLPAPEGLERRHGARPPRDRADPVAAAHADEPLLEAPVAKLPVDHVHLVSLSREIGREQLPAADVPREGDDAVAPAARLSEVLPAVEVAELLHLLPRNIRETEGVVRVPRDGDERTLRHRRDDERIASRKREREIAECALPVPAVEPERRAPEEREERKTRATRHEPRAQYEGVHEKICAPSSYLPLQPATARFFVPRMTQPAAEQGSDASLKRYISPNWKSVKQHLCQCLEAIRNNEEPFAIMADSEESWAVRGNFGQLEAANELNSLIM